MEKISKQKKKPQTRPRQQEIAATEAPAHSLLSFFSFLKEKEQKTELLALLSLYGLLNVLLYYCYPYPMSYFDSANYIYCAQTDVYGGFRPMGYSWFLQFFHAISNSFYFIGMGQFWFNALATCFFLFTIKYFYPPKNKPAFYLFALAVILSPVTLYLTHWVMSDSVFTSLTLLWLTSGIWLMHRLNWLVAAAHLIIMLLAIQVRFVGLFYPAVTCLMLLFAYRLRLKALAVVAATILVPFFIHHSITKTTTELFGVESFSGFSGWALANNAVSIIPYSDLKPEEIKDPQLRWIHQHVVQQPDSFYSPYHIVKTSFIWENEHAGKLVMQELQKHLQLSYTSSWIHTGELLSRYGKLLILNDPLAYLRHYILMNVKELLYPSVTIFEYMETPVQDFHRSWYKLEGVEKFEARFDLIGKYIDHAANEAALLLWILVAAAAAVVPFKWKTLEKTQRGIFLYLAGFSLAYIGFSIIAHPVHLRYLMPLHALQVYFVYLAVSAFKPQVAAKAQA